MTSLTKNQNSGWRSACSICITQYNTNFKIRIMNNQTLVQTLAECIAACNYCADACLDEENVSMMKECIRTDRACAAVCTTVHQLVVSGYTNISDLIQVCIRLCRECEQECAKHADMHDHCRRCMEACRKCADACGELAA